MGRPGNKGLWADGGAQIYLMWNWSIKDEIKSCGSTGVVGDGVVCHWSSSINGLYNRNGV